MLPMSLKKARTSNASRVPASLRPNQRETLDKLSKSGTDPFPQDDDARRRSGLACDFEVVVHGRTVTNFTSFMPPATLLDGTLALAADISESQNLNCHPRHGIPRRGARAPIELTPL